MGHAPEGGAEPGGCCTNRSGWWSGSLTPFFNYGINRGYYTNDCYLNSVMAGWEFGPGDYTAHSWGVAGF